VDALRVVDRKDESMRLPATLGDIFVMLNGVRTRSLPDGR
jgi:hypothetical protein